MDAWIRDGLQLTSDAGVVLLGLHAGHSDGPPDSLRPINPPTLQLLQLTRGPPQQGKPRNPKAPGSRLQTQAGIDLSAA